MLSLPPVLLVEHIERFPIEHQIRVVDGVGLLPEFLGLEIGCFGVVVGGGDEVVFLLLGLETT